MGSDLTPNWQGQFATFNEWVSFATTSLTGRTGSVGEPVPAICVDAKGRRCHVGMDFARARDENAFPVRFFWDCEPTPEPRCDYGISDEGVMTPTPEWERPSNESVMLRLMMASVEVDEATIAGWTDEQVQQSDIWAFTTHLSASDNDDIQVPAKPDFLPGYETFRGIVPEPRG